MTTMRPRRRTVAAILPTRGGQIGSYRRGLGAPIRGVRGRQGGQHSHPGGLGRDPHQIVAPGDDHANAVAVARRPQPECRQARCHQVALFHERGAEVEAGRRRVADGEVRAAEDLAGA